jgi:hypothetical protein
MDVPWSTLGAPRGLWGRAKLLQLPHVIGRFGKEPVPKGDDLWKRRCGLRTDDPVGLGETQLFGEGTQQPPVDQVRVLRARTMP